MREISIRSLLLHSDGDRSGVDSVVGAAEGREIPAVDVEGVVKANHDDGLAGLGSNDVAVLIERHGNAADADERQLAAVKDIAVLGEDGAGERITVGNGHVFGNNTDGQVVCPGAEVGGHGVGAAEQVVLCEHLFGVVGPGPGGQTAMTGCEDDISEHHGVVVIAGAVVGLEVAIELADCGADTLLFFNSVQVAPVVLAAAEVAERHLRPFFGHTCHNVMCLVLRAVAPVVDAVIEGDNADAIGHAKLPNESLERGNNVGVVGLDLDELDDVIIAKSFEVLAQGGDMILFGVIVNDGVLAALDGAVGFTPVDDTENADVCIADVLKY